MIVNKRSCEKQDVKMEEIRRIGKKLSECLRDIDRLGLKIFGGTWNLTIRGDDELILAEFDECRTSGGCGAQHLDADGFLRGEQ